jgi:flagellin
MSFTITDRGLNAKLNRYVERARDMHADSLEKLSSGEIFTARNPRPADRAVSDGMEFRLHNLASAKRNINDAVSLLQTAESGLQEVNNIITRMKEINIAGASSTVGDQERRYLFVEYQALYDEINRIALTTDFNGIPLLNGKSEAVPEEMIFRVGDPSATDVSFGEEEDVNAIRFSGLKAVVATTEGLGLRGAMDLLSGTSETEGISQSDAADLMEANQGEPGMPTVYDEALATLSTARAVYGALQARMMRAKDFVDVYQENLTAAKSKISDTDFATESVRLAESAIMLNASTAVLAQSNITGNLSLSLITNAIR